ncbi:MAG: tetraacyldisaccharide 4'-kinase [Candidatus Limimorpha sp.]
MKIFLAPLSMIYYAVLWIRHKLYDCGILKSRSVNIPTICIGNLALGGTGKTPHTEYLINLLKGKANVAVLSRGYGRKSIGYKVAGEDSSAKEIGDEPMMYKAKFKDSITVAVDEDRVEGVNNLLKEENKPDIVLLDDAFQHRGIRPGLNILLTEYHNIYKNDYLVPVGTLRDIAPASKRADIIIITKCPQILDPYSKREKIELIKPQPYQNVFFTTISFKKFCPVNETAKAIDIENNKSICLFCAIANPFPLEEYLKRSCNNLSTKYFKDHHNFSGEDIDKILQCYDSMIGKSKVLLTTEKDYMRLLNSPYLHKFDKVPLFTIPIEVKFNDKEEEKSFNKIILNYVGKNS